MHKETQRELINVKPIHHTNTFRNLIREFSLLLLLIIALIKNNLKAKTYYVSNNGDDAASGESPDSAWQRFMRLTNSQ
jgi:hypothetical protein